MRKFYFIMLLTAFFSLSCGKEKKESIPAESPSVQSSAEFYGAEIVTSMGTIEIAFMDDKSPETVTNFIRYAKAQFFNGTIFHRVIKDFMIQGGGFDTNFKQKRTYNPIKNEAANNIPNKRGTVAMARTAIVDSATSQFFINLKDNDFLNHTDDSEQGFGYCVFAEVTKGMNIVDLIGEAPTGSFSGFQDVPQVQISIKEVRLLKK